MKPPKTYQEYIIKLGQRIKLYRITKEMSQQDLAVKTGVFKRSISRLVPDQEASYYLKKPENKIRRVRKSTFKWNDEA